jgi:hypothetical protein
VTYHVVVAFDRDDDGGLKPSEGREATNAAAAMRHARALSYEHAVAFSRAGRPATANLRSEILGHFGAVDLDALSA